jgi:hypothetical protein
MGRGGRSRSRRSRHRRGRRDGGGGIGIDDDDDVDNVLPSPPPLPRWRRRRDLPGIVGARRRIGAVSAADAAAPARRAPRHRRVDAGCPERQGTGRAAPSGERQVSDAGIAQ